VTTYTIKQIYLESRTDLLHMLRDSTFSLKIDSNI